ncbi:MAG: hypothetical protein LWX83_12565 [Anaerolineae bacterium]|nr:hypothetical protein [Anaerolineae bacterium]
MSVIKKSLLPSPIRNYLPALLACLSVFEGLAALLLLNAFSAAEPFAVPAMLITGVLLLLILAAVLILGFSVSARNRTARVIEDQLVKKERLPLCLIGLLAGLGLLLFVFVVFETRLQLKLQAFLPYYQTLVWLLIWLALLDVQLIVSSLLFAPQAWQQMLSMPAVKLRRLAWWLLGGASLVALAAIPLTARLNLGIFHFFIGFFLFALFILALFNFAWGHYAGRVWYAELSLYLTALLVFCVSICVYRAGTFITGFSATPLKSYFDLLADAWLHGQLYLSNPPYTHDLTFFNGNWYVANPPLAAVLLVPWVAWLGVNGLNTVIITVGAAAFTVGLVYILLERLSRLGWTQLKTADNLWLTALFGFGTPLWYISASGTMWSMSQVVTVLLLVLAVLVMLTHNSAWFSGAALALAAAARPHIFVFLPILLALRYIHTRRSGKTFGFKQFVIWGFATAFPVFLAGLALLGYNWLRFGNIWDYGYLTENVADFMADDLKLYGTFNPVFITRNLGIMLFALPRWSENCKAITPTFDGMSMFLTTPALFYLFKSFKRSPLAIGAWGSILLTLVPLMFYYNTGAWQYGYKYLLDFIVPVMVLLALAAGRRLSWFYRLLIVLSILMQAYGVLWFFKVICRA